jgi:hypothetical protein
MEQHRFVFHKYRNPQTNQREQRIVPCAGPAYPFPVMFVKGENGYRKKRVQNIARRCLENNRKRPAQRPVDGIERQIQRFPHAVQNSGGGKNHRRVAQKNSKHCSAARTRTWNQLLTHILLLLKGVDYITTHVGYFGI